MSTNEGLNHLSTISLRSHPYQSRSHCICSMLMYVNRHLMNVFRTCSKYVGAPSLPRNSPVTAAREVCPRIKPSVGNTSNLSVMVAICNFVPGGVQSVLTCLVDSYVAEFFECRCWCGIGVTSICTCRSSTLKAYEEQYRDLVCANDLVEEECCCLGQRTTKLLGGYEPRRGVQRQAITCCLS